MFDVDNVFVVVDISVTFQQISSTRQITRLNHIGVILRK